MRDISGEENGLWLTANCGPDLVPLGDEEFLVNMQSRLALPVGATGLCQRRRLAAKGEEEGRRCLHALDAYGSHAARCMVGGA